MSAEKIFNTIADLINGDISKEESIRIVENELSDTEDLTINDKSKLIEILNTYDESDNPEKFIKNVSGILQMSEEILDYANKNQ